MSTYDKYKRNLHDQGIDFFGVKGFRKVKLLVGVILALMIIGTVFTCLPLRVARDVVEKTITAENVVYNYQWYYDQFNSIQAQKANLKAVEKDSQEYRGMLFVLNRNIAEYNSKSSQITRNLWKANDLPYVIKLEE